MLYPAALDAGVTPEQFWNYTLAEIQDLIFSWQRGRKWDIKSQYDLAALISIYASKLLDSKNEVKTPYPWDAYPELFAEEKHKFEEQQREDALRSASISRREYARFFNRRRKVQGSIE